MPRCGLQEHDGPGSDLQVGADRMPRDELPPPTSDQILVPTLHPGRPSSSPVRPRARTRHAGIQSSTLAGVPRATLLVSAAL